MNSEAIVSKMENGNRQQKLAKHLVGNVPEEVRLETELHDKEKESQEVLESVDSNINETLRPSASDTRIEEEQVPIQQEVDGNKETKNDDPAEENIANGDIEIEENEHEEDELDFHDATKETLLVKIKEAIKEDSIPQVDRIIKALKPRFDELYETAKAEALRKFVEDGNELEAFEYHSDEIDREFQTIYAGFRDIRNKYYKDLEQQKQENLEKKQHLLEQLKEIIDSEETTFSIQAVKDIQAKWKKANPVPKAHNEALWANYHALIHRFNDKRTIYFELKDLDRKKNLKAKEKICQKAETLSNAHINDFKKVFVQLKKLHEEYKHIGPVSKENGESLWQRFKAASNAIHSKIKAELETNYPKKQELVNEAKKFSSFHFDKVGEWNTKTKEIRELQEKWKAIGGLPKAKAKAINKQFWHSIKTFFHHKNQFYKQLNAHLYDNLKKKEKLVAEAEKLKESTDWNDTTEKYKNLQTRWKEIGPVPEKVKNRLYERFRSACDDFFHRRRTQNFEREEEYQENLKLKLQICSYIESIADQDDISLNEVYDLIDNYSQLGFVPIKSIKKAKIRFEKATQKILSLEELNPKDKADLKNHILSSQLKNASKSNQKLQRKENFVRKRIFELENNITTWNTNMEFLADSATADKFKANLQQQINEAKGELEALKFQLSTLLS